jgi:alkylresorcinol/alkylpyrone synthase
MGWDLIETGLKVRFAKSVPQIVRTRTRLTLEEACERHGLELGDLRHFVVHPGGAKVLEAYEEALGFELGSLDLSREVLRGYRARSEEYGTISALGPGFSAEHVLFRC